MKEGLTKELHDKFSRDTEAERIRLTKESEDERIRLREDFETERKRLIEEFEAEKIRLNEELKDEKTRFNGELEARYSQTFQDLKSKADEFEAKSNEAEILLDKKKTENNCLMEEIDKYKFENKGWI